MTAPITARPVWHSASVYFGQAKWHYAVLYFVERLASVMSHTKSGSLLVVSRRLKSAATILIIKDVAASFSLRFSATSQQDLVSHGLRVSFEYRTAACRIPNDEGLISTTPLRHSNFKKIPSIKVTNAIRQPGGGKKEGSKQRDQE